MHLLNAIALCVFLSPKGPFRLLAKGIGSGVTEVDTNPEKNQTAVECSTNSMTLRVPRERIEGWGDSLATVHLLDIDCKARLDETRQFFVFKITGDLTSECGTRMEKNNSHFIFYNEVRAILHSAGQVLKGPHFIIPFQCTLPRSVDLTLKYEAVLDYHRIPAPPGVGRLDVFMAIYRTNQFLMKETKTSFTTSHILYVQAQLMQREASLSIVLERCWATPSDDKDDATQVGIIENRCPVVDGSADRLKVIKNGEGPFAQFQVQVFKFIKEKTVYLHCRIGLCRNSTGSCATNCLNEAKKKTPGERRKRSDETAVGSNEFTLGPFTQEESGLKEFDKGVSSMLLFVGVFGVALVIAAQTRRRRLLKRKN